MSKDVTSKERSEFMRNYHEIVDRFLYRLKDIMQCMVDPTCKTTRTRFLHVMDVELLSGSVAARLPEAILELAVAVAVGHDAGHWPYTHDTERFLRKQTGDNTLNHGKMGVRILSLLGIKLNKWVAYGIANHSDGDSYINQEINVPEEEFRYMLSCVLVWIVDDICCAVSDIGDLLKEKRENAPIEARKAFNAVLKDFGIKIRIPLKGVISEDVVENAQFRILSEFVEDIIINSKGKKGIFMSDSKIKAFKDMKGYFYNQILQSEEVKAERQEVVAKVESFVAKAEEIIIKKDFVKTELGRDLKGFTGLIKYPCPIDPLQVTIDYLSTLTESQLDQYIS